MPNTEQSARYREIRRLGTGGMATVTLAEDTVLGRPVALKRVYGAGDPRGMLRLKREALVGASLNHPNIVSVYDAQLQDDGDVVIVMEYVEGETLADVIGSRGPLSPTESIRILTGVAAALDAIHERGIVHRDIKPANVLLGHDGTIKLADLGVADVADRTRITTAGAVVGSFSYMAAEQLDGAPPSPAMDIYALAAVTYEMLTGDKARTESNPLALAHAISSQPPPNLRDVWPAAPPAAATVLQRAMSAHPAERPRSAVELVRQLESAFDRAAATQTIRRSRGGPRAIPLPPPPPSRTAGRERRRAAPLAVLAALAVLAVCGVVVAALASGGGSTRSGSGTASGSASRPAKTGTTHPATTGTHSATTAASGSSTSTATRSPTAPSSPTPAAPPTPGTSSAGTPVNAVTQFYETAAAHHYAAAWALAGPNLRSQLGGYSAFQNLMSSVRSITFHRAQVLPGSTPTTATVALDTTSVQTDRIQQCKGTAQTVRSGAGWLADGISIRCS